jgi:hypothetical protein
MPKDPYLEKLMNDINKPGSTSSPAIQLARFLFTVISKVIYK